MRHARFHRESHKKSVKWREINSLSFSQTDSFKWDFQQEEEPSKGANCSVRLSLYFWMDGWSYYCHNETCGWLLKEVPDSRVKKMKSNQWNHQPQNIARLQHSFISHRSLKPKTWKWKGFTLSFYVTGQTMVLALMVICIDVSQRSFSSSAPLWPPGRHRWSIRKLMMWESPRSQK